MNMIQRGYICSRFMISAIFSINPSPVVGVVVIRHDTTSDDLWNGSELSFRRIDRIGDGASLFLATYLVV